MDLVFKLFRLFRQKIESRFEKMHYLSPIDLKLYSISDFESYFVSYIILDELQKFTIFQKYIIFIHKTTLEKVYERF